MPFTEIVLDDLERAKAWAAGKPLAELAEFAGLDAVPTRWRVSLEATESGADQISLVPLRLFVALAYRLKTGDPIDAVALTTPAALELAKRTGLPLVDAINSERRIRTG